MNPAPIPSCGIVVPLGESLVPGLRHPCAVKRSKRRCSLGRINRRHVGSEAPRLPSVLAAHRHRKQTAASSNDNAEPTQSTNGRQRVFKIIFKWICCPCFIELQSFAGVSEFPFRAALQPSPAGRIRKTVSVLTGQIPQSFGLYLKADLPAFHLIAWHRPVGLLIVSVGERSPLIA